MDPLSLSELRSKLSLEAIPKPALVGIVAVILMVAVLVGRLLLNTATANEIAFEPSPAEVSEEEATTARTLFVHVSGCVANPGLTELPEGSRVADAIDACGGLTEEADAASVNLARTLSDGEQVIVSARKTDSAAAETVGGQSPATSTEAPAKVSINRASVEELTTLKGVGEATAEKIVAYRQKNGSFSTLEGLMEVSGIGEKKFEALKDQITL